jgi:hypothetical protein
VLCDRLTIAIATATAATAATTATTAAATAATTATAAAATVAAAAATVAATAATAATTAATAATAIFTGTSFVDLQRTAFSIVSVKFFNGGLRILIGCHFDEAKSTRTTGFTVINDFSFHYGTRLCEEV